MHINELDEWFQRECSIADFALLDKSANGLQVSHRLERIKKLAFAVDACLETFMRCRDADVLVVHHGLFWGREQVLTSHHYDRIRFLMEHDIALYAIHLPLDAHPELGNNYGMAHSLGLENLAAFGFYQGKAIGVSGELPQEVDLSEIQEILFGSNVLRVLPFGKKQLRRVAMVSGGGSYALDEAIEKNIDLFISGDADHTLYHRCLEAKINVMFAGHYITEVWGVKLLMERFLQGPGAEQGIMAEFIDLPTGL